MTYKMVTGQCWLCRAPAEFKCDKCGIEACSKTHLELHTKLGGVGDGSQCLPFQIVFREGVGNCVTATRDIRPGEVILSEKPAVWGPNLKSPPKCCNCLARWQSGATCPECQFPVCDDTCARGATHAQECGTLANLDIDITFTVGEAANPAMSLINVVRFLRLPQTSQDPDLVSRVEMLMDHVEDMSTSPLLMSMWRDAAVTPLTSKLPASPYTEGDILHAVGVLQTNTISLAVPGQKTGLYTGLYPTFSFLSHRCICNAKFNVLRDRTLQLTAQTRILAGEEISIQYVTPLLGNLQRRARTMKNWYFECGCPRCRDSSELGTMVSGVTCDMCGDTLLPRKNAKGVTVYQCDVEECDKCLSCEQVLAMETELEDEMEARDCSDLEVIQSLVNKWTPHLHSQHFLMLLLKRKLLAALKKSPPPSDKQNTDYLRQIVSLCEEQLRVWDVLDPGLTLLRGRMLQFMNGPRMLLAKQDLLEGRITKKDFMMETALAMKMVKTATKCFDENSMFM